MTRRSLLVLVSGFVAARSGVARAKLRSSKQRRYAGVMAAPEPSGMVTAPAVLRSARQQHRRSQRRIAREELARRSIELNRAEAGLPWRSSQRGVSQIASPNAPHTGMSKLGLQEVAILERAERRRQYVATVAALRAQAAHTQMFGTQVALEQAAAATRARIEALQFELVKREQWSREWTRCVVRIGQVGHGHVRPDFALEFPVRLRHGTTVNDLIAAASSANLMSQVERDYLERNTGIVFETGCSCCTSPLAFGEPRYALRQIRLDGSVRPLAERDASGCEWTLDRHGICDGAILLLEPV